MQLIDEDILTAFSDILVLAYGNLASITGVCSCLKISIDVHIIIFFSINIASASLAKPELQHQGTHTVIGLNSVCHRK